MIWGPATTLQEEGQEDWYPRPRGGRHSGCCWSKSPGAEAGENGGLSPPSNQKDKKAGGSAPKEEAEDVTQPGASEGGVVGSEADADRPVGRRREEEEEGVAPAPVPVPLQAPSPPVSRKGKQASAPVPSIPTATVGGGDYPSANPTRPQRAKRGEKACERGGGRAVGKAAIPSDREWAQHQPYRPPQAAAGGHVYVAAPELDLLCISSHFKASNAGRKRQWWGSEEEDSTLWNARKRVSFRGGVTRL